MGGWRCEVVLVAPLPYPNSSQFFSGRWIVEERPDGANVNGWHWTEKDVFSIAEGKLKEVRVQKKLPRDQEGGGGAVPAAREGSVHHAWSIVTSFARGVVWWRGFEACCDHAFPPYLTESLSRFLSRWQMIDACECEDVRFTKVDKFDGFVQLVNRKGKLNLQYRRGALEPGAPLPILTWDLTTQFAAWKCQSNGSGS
jgi:hypothetical protein